MTKPLTAWSYSRYALYAQCPLKFKLEVIDGLKAPQSPAMARGNKVHVDLANYLKGQALLPAAVTTPYQVKLYAEMRAFPDKLVEHQQGFTNQWKPTGWFGADTWYRQIYDVALLYEDMTAEAVDHKTGKRYGSNAEQMELQAVSLMCQYKPVTHVTTRLIYVDSGEEEIAEFPAVDREKLTAKWNSKVAPMFSDKIFAPRPNDKCKFCQFSKSNNGVCRFG